ncbi:selenoneine synthase SenA [Massilia sp. ST3]|uniref:selenoneine synthase SenA n=1 Tax=Massilia sp. ST3 TaxID=2824903 RepID=UPI001B8250C4|nr:selenoneine synthase SenA [Massilia sp. ST3]MBQ5949982.1 SUMF1/EgtB/PvdO family nonheme iron enzyme [Massilia sp. ST3]
MKASFRTAAPEALARALEDARARTLAFFDRFAEAGMDAPANVPLLPIVNPPLWELGHIAWFAEWYILRGARSSAPGSALRPSLLAGSDAWFDSGSIAHDARWSLGLPPADEIKAYCRAVLDGVLASLGREGDEDAALYFYRLVLAHEDMHGEAYAYTLQTLGLSWPGQPGMADAGSAAAAAADELRIDGGVVELGSRPGAGFVFDNEKWAHAVELAPFAIDAALVSNAAYARFAAAGGYRDARLWTEAGRAWLAQQGAQAPRGWRREGDAWYVLRFGQPVPLALDEPVRHVCLHEAQAYCAWAGRRLPSEAEWVRAAAHPGFRWGELWEWTASPFAAYPGFAADAYRDYSAPYFGTHQALRGASFATPERLRSAAFRNFYAPQRSDMFVGFRTCR